MFTEKTFDTGKIKLNYAEGPASGPPLLFLHGLSSCWQGFLPMLPHLVLRHHVYALDFRGHGSSGQAPSYTLSDYADDALLFLQQQVREPAALVGYSLGGMVSMVMEAQYPGLAKALVTGDSAFTVESARSIYPIFLLLQKYARMQASVWEIADGLATETSTLPGVDQPLRLDQIIEPSFLRFCARCLIQDDPEIFTQIIDAFEGRADLRAEGYEAEKLLPKIKCPVLLLQADPALGGLVTDEDVAMAMRLLPRAIHAKFPGLGHSLGLDTWQVGPVVRSVSDFLEMAR